MVGRSASMPDRACSSVYSATRELYQKQKAFRGFLRLKAFSLVSFAGATRFMPINDILVVLESFPNGVPLADPMLPTTVPGRSSRLLLRNLCLKRRGDCHTLPLTLQVFFSTNFAL